MKVVADTSVVVSALLWPGLPHRILIAAETSAMMLYTSPALLDEWAGVLARSKFSMRLSARRVTVEELVTGYARLAHLVLPRPIAPVIHEDPSDDAVLACALSAQARFIVSSDPHLLRLDYYRSIQIVSPRAFFTSVLPHHTL